MRYVFDMALKTYTDRVQTYTVPIAIGDTLTYKNVLPVIKMAQFLLHWAHTEYRPWFDKNILVPLKLLDNGESSAM